MGGGDDDGREWTVTGCKTVTGGKMAIRVIFWGVGKTWAGRTIFTT